MGSPTCDRCLGAGTYFDPRTGMRRMANCPECHGTGHTPTPPAPADDATRGCTVAFCETHRDVEIVPGPFCPSCLANGVYGFGRGHGVEVGKRLANQGKSSQPAANATRHESASAEAMREACVQLCLARARRFRHGAGTQDGVIDAIEREARECAAAIRDLPIPATDDAVEEARNAVLDAVATWRAAEKRIAAAYLRGQIDTATFTKRNDEAAAGELTEIRLASDALDAALRRAKGSPR